MEAAERGRDIQGKGSWQLPAVGNTFTAAGLGLRMSLPHLQASRCCLAFPLTAAPPVEPESCSAAGSGAGKSSTAVCRTELREGTALLGHPSHTGAPRRDVCYYKGKKNYFICKSPSRCPDDVISVKVCGVHQCYGIFLSWYIPASSSTCLRKQMHSGGDLSDK